MIAQITRKLFTVAEYHKMAEVGILKPTDHVQLINGEIIRMSPVKSKHASIVDKLSRILNFALFDRAIAKAQNPIKLNNNSEPEPDIAIVQYKKNEYEDAHPKPAEIYWLIEVSDSTLRMDQTLKKKLYAKSGIQEYWIINIPENTIEVYRDLKSGKYKEMLILKKGDTAKFEQLNFELAVDTIL